MKYLVRVSSNRAERKMASLITRWRWPRSNRSSTATFRRRPCGATVGAVSGPTIEAEQGEPIYVRWQNHLPDEHLLPEDPTIHGDIIPYDELAPASFRTSTVATSNTRATGKPQAWFTRDFEQTGPDFEKKDYYYANEQPPATLWYHDHSLGITRLNVYAGLAGFYLLRNDHERELDLPTSDNEIPLVLQDRVSTRTARYTTRRTSQRQKRMKTIHIPTQASFRSSTATRRRSTGRHGPDCPSIPNSTGSACSTVPTADTTTSSCSNTTRNRATRVSRAAVRPDRERRRAPLGTGRDR